MRNEEKVTVLLVQIAKTPDDSEPYRYHLEIKTTSIEPPKKK